LYGGYAAFDLEVAKGDDALRLAAEIREAVDATAGLTNAPRDWLEEAERALRLFGRPRDRRRARGDRLKPAACRRDVRPEHGEGLFRTGGSALRARTRARPLLRGLRLIDERAEADLFEALLPFARRVRARQIRAGLIDFDALLVRARELIRRRPGGALMR
jgi:hypothetical protein